MVLGWTDADHNEGMQLQTYRVGELTHCEVDPVRPTPPVLFEIDDPIKEVRLMTPTNGQEGVFFVANSGPFERGEPAHGLRYAYGQIVTSQGGASLEYRSSHVVDNANTQGWTLADRGPNGRLAAWVDVRIAPEGQVEHRWLHFARWTEERFTGYGVYKVLGEDQVYGPSFGGLGVEIADMSQFQLIWSEFGAEEGSRVLVTDGRFCDAAE